MLAVALLGLVLLGPLAVLTGIGAAERGAAPALAVLAGAIFPVTWVAWYVRDELPQRDAGRG